MAYHVCTGVWNFERRQPVGAHVRKVKPMQALNLITLLLTIIIGGLNWLLVGIAGFDPVDTIFGGQGRALGTIV